MGCRLRWRERNSAGGGHDRGEVLVDLAVILADDGKTISDLRTLRNQPALFGDVASTPTAWRTLGAVDGSVLAAIGRARAKARAAAWAAGMDPGFYVLDFDGTLVNSHSEKEQAAPTYKRGFGFHPLLVYLDATGEALAGKLRPGNAGSNTTADHVEVLDAALEQLPVDPHEVEVVARADSGGLSHGFVDACRDRGVRFAIGYDLTETVRSAVLAVPKRRWVQAVAADGIDERDGAEVAEITDLLDLSSWPKGTRAITRRKDPHPGAQLTFTDVDGHRFQVFITDLPDPDIAYLEALHRGRGRTEQRIRDAKDTGLRNLPSENFAINAAWLASVLIAHLIAWAQHLCLDGGTGPSRTETTPLLPLPHRRPDRPERTAHLAAPRRRLALGRTTRPRLPPAPNPAAPGLNDPAQRSAAVDAPAHTRNSHRGTTTPLEPASPGPTITGNTANNAAEPRSDRPPKPY